MKKPSIILSFLLSVCALIVFYFSYIIIYLVMSGAFYALRNIPLIGPLFALLYSEDAPFTLLMLGVPTFTYVLVCALLKKVTKNPATTNLSSRILGIFLVLINLVSLILNLAYHETNLIITNIAIGIVGIAFIIKDFSK